MSTLFPSPAYWSALAVLPPAPILVWSEGHHDTFIEWNDGSQTEVIIHVDHETGSVSACWDHRQSGEETEWEQSGVSDAESFERALVALWRAVTAPVAPPPPNR
jgi:hypothetical protein